MKQAGAAIRVNVTLHSNALKMESAALKRPPSSLYRGGGCVSAFRTDKDLSVLTSGIYVFRFLKLRGSYLNLHELLIRFSPFVTHRGGGLDLGLL